MADSWKLGRKYMFNGRVRIGNGFATLDLRRASEHGDIAVIYLTTDHSPGVDVLSFSPPSTNVLASAPPAFNRTRCLMVLRSVMVFIPTEGAVLCSLKTIYNTRLQAGDRREKTSLLDSHVVCASAGLTADTMVLVKDCRVRLPYRQVLERHVWVFCAAMASCSPSLLFVLFLE